MRYIRGQISPTTPERVRNVAQRNERGQRVLESPEYHRPPHHVRIAQLGTSVPPIPPIAPPPAPIFRHFPENLAQQYAALPPFPRQPVRGRGRGRGINTIAPAPAPQLAPAFVPAMRYQYLPADLAQQAAALPDVLQPAFVPAPPVFVPPPIVPPPAPVFRYLPADLAQQHAALIPFPRQPVRGRGRGRGINTPVPASLPFSEIAARYAALQPVCFF